MRTELSELEKNILDCVDQPIGVKKKLTSIWLEQKEVTDKNITQTKLIMYLLPTFFVGLLQFVFAPSLFFKLNWDLSNMALYQGVSLVLIVAYPLYVYVNAYINTNVVLRSAKQILSASCVLVTVKEQIGNRYYQTLKPSRLYNTLIAFIHILHIVGLIVMIAAGAWLPALIIIVVSLLTEIPKNKLKKKVNIALFHLEVNMSRAEKFGWKEESDQSDKD